MEYNFKCYEATNAEELIRLEANHRNRNFFEYLPFAVNTSYTEVADSVVRDSDGAWAHPLTIIVSKHSNIIGAIGLCRKAADWYDRQSGIDVLSIASGMEDNTLMLHVLVRLYKDPPDLKSFFDYVGDDIEAHEETVAAPVGELQVPEHLRFDPTEEDISAHERRREVQAEPFATASFEKPFLNQIDTYEPESIRNPADYMPLVYNVKSKDRELKLLTQRGVFDEIFRELMTYVSGVERYNYMEVMSGEADQAAFLTFLEKHVVDEYVSTRRLAAEDLPTLMERAENALFKLYVLQDIIDDPNVSDIKITAYDAIRVRVRGRAYLSNVKFIDVADYSRFIDGICVRNGVKKDSPEQTFTDQHDEDYILRFTLSPEYINADAYPYLHIRKVPRKKMLDKELIAAGMMDEKLRDYLLDCGRHSRGVVFAGPPGSGKTYLLNWFLECAYEDSCEILVIQENDELFAYRKGVMFQHVVGYSYRGNQAISLEELGQLALVAGANVFVIGEAKGGEICSAITLSNSGCRTALTVHSPSAAETIDKMADLAMRGYAQNYDQAKRMLKSFQTIVYLENFKIKEITEITGYDEDKHDMTYRYIYRRDA